jgi:ribosomal protein S18 acetylase RimI-like enzyme
MTRAVLEIRLLRPDEWQVLRDVRLQALCDAPHAFAADPQQELLLSDDQWRQRLRTAVWVVATEDDAVIGIAGLVRGDPAEPEHVESVWVAPAHRHRGVSTRLLRRVEEIARGRQLSDLWLWVMEDNLLAQQVYARFGFRWTGERKLIDVRRQLVECRMRRAIRGRATVSERAPRS